MTGAWGRVLARAVRSAPNLAVPGAVLASHHSPQVRSAWAGRLDAERELLTRHLEREPVRWARRNALASERVPLGCAIPSASGLLDVLALLRRGDLGDRDAAGLLEPWARSGSARAGASLTRFCYHRHGVLLARPLLVPLLARHAPRAALPSLGFAARDEPTQHTLLDALVLRPFSDSQGVVRAVAALDPFPSTSERVRRLVPDPGTLLSVWLDPLSALSGLLDLVSCGPDSNWERSRASDLSRSLGRVLASRSDPDLLVAAAEADVGALVDEAVLHNPASPLAALCAVVSHAPVEDLRRWATGPLAAPARRCVEVEAAARSVALPPVRDDASVAGAGPSLVRSLAGPARSLVHAPAGTLVTYLLPLVGTPAEEALAALVSEGWDGTLSSAVLAACRLTGLDSSWHVHSDLLPGPDPADDQFTGLLF